MIEISDETLIKAFKKMGMENSEENLIKAGKDFDRELGMFYNYDSENMSVYKDQKDFCEQKIRMSNQYQITDSTIQIKEEKNHYHFRGDTLAIQFGRKGLHFYSLNISVSKDICN